MKLGGMYNSKDVNKLLEYVAHVIDESADYETIQNGLKFVLYNYGVRYEGEVGGNVGDIVDFDSHIHRALVPGIRTGEPVVIKKVGWYVAPGGELEHVLVKAVADNQR